MGTVGMIFIEILGKAEIQRLNDRLIFFNYTSLIPQVNNNTCRITRMLIVAYPAMLITFCSSNLPN